MANTTNVLVLAKKISNVVSVLVFMLRKRKLMLDLNMLMKRSKTKIRRAKATISQEEYEFSCSNTPVFKFKKCHKGSFRFFSCSHAPPTKGSDYDEDVVKSYEVQKVFEMLNNEAPSSAVYCFLKSPMVRDVMYGDLASPGIGKTPVVRQLRVTDSPFPVVEAELDSQVDLAAEEFISKFYKNLRKQNKLAPPL